MPSNPDLPADLAELERRLGGPREGPAAGLRQRVLAAVRRGPGPVDAGGLWGFAAAVAAAAVLLINLSMSAANNTDWRLAADPVSDERRAVDGIRELSPETTEREASRQALLLRQRPRLTPGAPVPRPSPSLSLFSAE